MPNLNQKYHTYTIPWYGVILKRFYVGDTPDEVGTIEFWSEPVRQLFDQVPFLYLWSGLELEIWHMGSPDLVSTTQQTLLDYDLSVPGYQVAAGLTFGKKRIALGIFPDGWSPTGGGTDHLTETNRVTARNAISHEYGHFLRFASDMDRETSIGSELRREWGVLRPNQTTNTHEDFAETVRACLGVPGAKGTFSDGKGFIPSPKLLTFIKTVYWLGVNLALRPVSGLTIFDTYVRWFRTDENKYYALTSNWDQFVWDGAKWVRL